MSLFYIEYILISTFILIIVSPLLFLYSILTGRYLKGLNERFGWISENVTSPPPGGLRIWIHAASLGEVRAAETIVHELKRLIPGCSLIISTMTEHGKDLASEIFGRDARIIYSPLDIIFFVRMALLRIRPDALVFLETEIWPAWISQAARMGIRTVIVNGRISERSFNRYLRIIPLFRYVLSRVNAFSMISEADRSRITAMGADPARVDVNGNAKFDLLRTLAEPSIERDIRSMFNLKGTSPVIIAGSTHRGEESIIIDAYRRIIKEFPETILFIAPRHIERSREIAALLEKDELEYRLRSEFKDASCVRDRQIVILDSFGELFRLYSAGTVAICGGSLARLGGQNPLEAAVWGRPVLYGPHMEDFLDARALLEENNAGLEVSSGEDLAEKVIMLLRDKDLLEGYGGRARDAVLKNRRAAERHARVILNILTGTH